MSSVVMGRSTPIEQGMNCEKLCKLVKYIKSNNQKIHSLLILRNGYNVTDINSYPYHSEVSYYLNCCTASIVSALVGIAIEEGLIGSINDKVARYFPEYCADIDQQLKNEITVEHLLQMTAGLEWDDVNIVFGENNYDNRMHRSEDPVRFILEQPMRDKPGKRYNHCLGAPHLLSALIQRVTGMSTSAYAEEKLFKPMGISGTEWFNDINGVSIGGNGLAMSAQGLAKIGQLFLQKGKWEGMQLIPENWINISTKKHIETPQGPWSFYGGGYQWNMNRFGGYSAKGVNGQYISVIPALNLVVVMIASLSIDELFWPETLMETFVIPATKFPGTSQTDMQNQGILENLIEEINQPPIPKTVPSMPTIASKISGQKYVFKAAASINGISLDFSKKNTCILKVCYEHDDTTVPVGLDDVYRISGCEAYKGSWKNSNTFVVKMLNLRMSYEMEYKFTFKGNKVRREVFSPAMGESEKIEGEFYYE